MFGADMFETTDKMRKEFVEQSLTGLPANVLVSLVLGIIEANRFASLELSKMVSEGKCNQKEIDKWIYLAVSQWDKGPAVGLYKILSKAKYQFTAKQLKEFFKQLQHEPKVGDEIKSSLASMQ